MKFFILCFFGAASFVARLHAGQGQTTYYSSSVVQHPFVAVPVGPRGIAMGEAFTAVADDVFAIQTNPAGLALLKDPQLAFMHNEWNAALGVRQEFAAIGQNFDFGGLGLSLNYFSHGSYELRGPSGQLLGQAAGYGLAGALAYAKGFHSKKLHLGVMAQFSQESLGESSASNWDLGAGALYQVGESLRLGAALMHWRPDQDGLSSPSTFSLGGALELGKAFLFSAEGWLPFRDAPALKAGIEWSPAQFFSARLGYRLGLSAAAESVQYGPSFGLGTQLGALRIDYAFVGFGELSNSHRIATTINFSPGLFEPKPASSRTSGAFAEAESFFQQGLKYQQNHELYDALVAFKQATQANPAHASAKQYYAAVKADLDAQRAGGSEDPRFKKLIDDHMNAGLKSFVDGDLKKALTEWNTVIELDKTYTTANAYKQKAYVKIRESISRLKSAAAEALEKDDLVSAVKNLRELKNLADGLDDFQAAYADGKAQLDALQPRILAAVADRHGRGVDLYVKNQVEEAVALWKEALQLDPSDPKTLKRDIEKAQKLLELKNQNPATP